MTLAVAVAGPLGAAALLAVSVLAAAALSEKINPTPAKPVEEQLREATDLQDRQERLDEQVRADERARGRASVDSTHVSFPVFGIAFPVWLVLSTWAAAIEHLDRSAGGFPLALALRPLWSALVAAFLAAIAAGFFYRRWYRRQSWQRQAEIRARRQVGERRDFESRLKTIRNRRSPRRSKHY